MITKLAAAVCAVALFLASPATGNAQVKSHNRWAMVSVPPVAAGGETVGRAITESPLTGRSAAGNPSPAGATSANSTGTIGVNSHTGMVCGSIPREEE
jgi:hypothetical protein